MSIHVMNWVWKHSRHKGSGLLLLLAIADHAHDDGDGAYPSVQTLASKIRMSERQTQRLINSLAESKELEINKNAGPHRCHIYRVTFCQGDTPALEGGDILSAEGDITVSPKPSIEPSGTPSVPSDSNEFSVTTGVPTKRKTSIDMEFRGRMKVKYDHLIEVDDEIERAVAHKSFTKYDGKQRYVEDWLRRAVSYKPSQGETKTREKILKFKAEVDSAKG